MDRIPRTGAAMTEIHNKDMKSETTENKAVEENNKEPSVGALPPSDIKELLFRKNDSFWFLAWLGTVFSGAIYPASGNLLAFQMTEALTVLVIGGVLIGLCATPIMLTVAIATWALWLTRFRMYTASLAGGLSCAIAAVTFLNATHTYLSDGWKLIAIEALTGGIGCPLILYLLGRRMFSLNRRAKATKTPWQFTMKDLFVHFTVLALLISLWSLLFPHFYQLISHSSR
jgi:hypothetical protein